MSGGVDLDVKSRPQWTCHSTTAYCVALPEDWPFDKMDEQGYGIGPVRCVLNKRVAWCTAAFGCDRSFPRHTLMIVYNHSQTIDTLVYVPS